MLPLLLVLDAGLDAAPTTELLLLLVDASRSPNRVPPTTRRSRAAAALPLECAGVGAGKREAAHCSTIPDQQPQIAENHRLAKPKLIQPKVQEQQLVIVSATGLNRIPHTGGFSCRISDRGFKLQF